MEIKYFKKWGKQKQSYKYDVFALVNLIFLIDAPRVHHVDNVQRFFMLHGDGKLKLLCVA